MTSLDPIPLIIEAEEWDYLKRGIQQRMQSFQLFFQDIYDQRNILREGIIPLSLILDNPEFYRECVHLFQPNQSFFQWAACDLAKDSEGNWYVIRDHFSIPPMLSFALQNRLTQNQIFPELYEERLVQSISHFPLELLETLKSCAAAPDQAQIVVLSNATSQTSEFDHHSLARKLGLPVVHPQDLTVRNAVLHYKTIDGLRPIHLLLRCTNSNQLDPLTFNGLAGTPGLIDCLRFGNLQILNAPGTGIIGLRPLLKYTEAMVRYYKEESPILPALPTYLSEDREQFNHLLENKERYLFADRLNTYLSEQEIQKTIQSAPTSLVAHPRMVWDKTPVFDLKTREMIPLPYTLRCFATIRQQEIQIMPGGLTQVWKNEDLFNHSEFIAKDTWVIGGENRRTHRSLPLIRKNEEIPLGSRLAQSLFWMGRYLERAEATARFLYILDEIHRESSNRPQRALPLWQALSVMTGHKEDYLPRLYRKDHAKVSWYLTLDPKNPSSIFYSIQQAQSNASDLLDYIPPEGWTILNRLTQKLSELATTPTQEEETSLFSIRESLDHILNQTSAFHGMLFRTMPHDRGRDFLNLGSYLERSYLTLTALLSLYSDKNMIREESKKEERDIENELLTLLLRGLCTLDNYRRQFQFRSLPLPVAEFLLKDKQAPISLQFCFKRLHSLLSRSHHPSLQTRSEAMLRWANEIELTNLFPLQTISDSKGEPLFLNELQKIRNEIENLANQINDYFFTHQEDYPILFMNEESKPLHEIEVEM